MYIGKEKRQLLTQCEKMWKAYSKTLMIYHRFLVKYAAPKAADIIEYDRALMENVKLAHHLLQQNRKLDETLEEDV